MSVAVLPQTISVDDAVEIVWSKVMAGEYANVSQACRDLWRGLRLSSDDLAWLALEGFAHVAQAQQASIKTTPGSTRPSIGFGSQHGKRLAGVTSESESVSGEVLP